MRMITFESKAMSPDITENIALKFFCRNYAVVSMLNAMQSPSD